MKITARKKLATAKWRTLGEGQEFKVRHYITTGVPADTFRDTYNLMLDAPVESFVIQLSEDEARKLLVELSNRLTRIPPKRVAKRTQSIHKENAV